MINCVKIRRMKKLSEVYPMDVTQINPTQLILNCLFKVLPKADREMKSYLTSLSPPYADGVDFFDEQTVKHLLKKGLYLKGECIYTLYPKVKLSNMIKIITSFKMIIYFIDNYCNKLTVKNEAAFRQLYLALLDAVDPKRSINNYFKYCPDKKYNESLQIFVEFCRNQLKDLPSYCLVSETIKKYIQYYSDLQIYKHIGEKSRDELIKTWIGYYINQYQGIYWWEFASSLESLLGVFALFAIAYDPDLTAQEVITLDSVYFPWVCSMHSLLNHYVNAQDHYQVDNLNFTSYYKNLKQCEERLSFFIEKSLIYCSKLKYSDFHSTIIKTFIAIYLSDPRAFFAMYKLSSMNLLTQPTPPTTYYYRVYRFLRFIKVV